jgi:hypothetical protein
MTSILTMEDRIDSMLQQLENILDEEAANGSMFDLSKWINFFTIDIITELAFGEAFGCLKTRGDVNGIISGLQGGLLFSIMLTIFPWIGTIMFSGVVSKHLKPPEEEGIGMALKVSLLKKESETIVNGYTARGKYR